MRSSSKVLIGLGVAALAAFALEVASPYVAMHRLQTALLAGDEEEIRDRVDFVKVREAMREDAAARTLDASREKTENGDAAAARAAGPGGAGTGRLIDAYATPKGLAEIARTGKNPLAEERAVAFGYVARWKAASAARHPEAQSVESESESKTDAGDSAGPQGRGKNAPAPTWRLRWRKWSQCVVELRNPTEIGGLNLYMRRNGLFSWQVERLVSVDVPKRPTEEEVLTALGCQCCESGDPSRKTALCRLPASYRPADWDDQPRFRPGGLVRTEVLGAYEARTGDTSRLLVLVFSLPAEEYGDAHANGSLLGTVQYQLTGKQWRVESVDLTTMDGPYAPALLDSNVEPVEVGTGRYGWAVHWTELGGGEYPIVSLLALRSRRLQKVWEMIYTLSAGDFGWEHRSPARWRFDTASGGELFDIIVEHEAATIGNVETHRTMTVSPPWTERWKFVGDAYKSTNQRLHTQEPKEGWYGDPHHSAKAVNACRRALEGQAKDAHPQEWAQTQTDLGDALSGHARDVGAAESVRLFRAAADAYRRALEVWSKGAQPQEWAFAQSRLGDVLSILAERAGDAESAQLFAEAVGSYRSALEVWTKDSQPQDWATMQDRLGNALRGQAKQAAGAESARLFAEAADAYRHELEVRTEEFDAWNWGMAQHGLGFALGRQARSKEGAESARLWSEAASAFRHALKIMWPQDSKARGADGALEQFLLGESLACQAELTDGVESARLLDEAVVAYRHTLEVLTKDGDPQNWAIVQEQLRRALSLRANQRPRTPSDCAAGGAKQR